MKKVGFLTSGGYLRKVNPEKPTYDIQNDRQHHQNGKVGQDKQTDSFKHLSS